MIHKLYPFITLMPVHCMSTWFVYMLQTLKTDDQFPVSKLLLDQLVRHCLDLPQVDFFEGQSCDIE